MSDRQVFTDPMAEVQIDPVSIAGEVVSSKVAVRVKADDGSWSQRPMIHSSDYNLIKNHIARDIGSDIMSRSNMEWKELKTIWDGRHFCAYHITQQPLAEINGRADRQHFPLHLGMMVRNSYDGSCVFGLEMFACNIVCTNQYIDRNRFGYFAIRHNAEKKFDVQDAIASVGVGAQNLIAIAPRIQELREQPLTVKAITDARMNTEIPKSNWGDVLEQLHKEEGTLFGLYQALTFTASHIISGFSSIRVGENITKYLVK